MPCPAKELGGIRPFVAMQKFRCDRETFVARGAWMERGCLWRVRARHAVPLLSETTKAKRTMSRVRQAIAIVLQRSLAQAGMPVLLNCKCKRAGRMPALQGRKRKSKAPARRRRYEKNDVAVCAKQLRSRRGVTLAQATFSRPPDRRGLCYLTSKAPAGGQRYERRTANAKEPAVRRRYERQRLRLRRWRRGCVGLRGVGTCCGFACWRGAWRCGTGCLRNVWGVAGWRGARRGVELLLRRRLRANWARDVVNHGDVHGGGRGGALGLRGVEVAAAFFEDVDEELLDAAGVFGAVAEFVDDAGEGAGHFVFVEAGAAHGVADADARRRRGGDGARGDGCGVAEG